MFVSTTNWNMHFVLVLLFAGCLGVANIFLINYGFEHVSAVIAGNILALEAVTGAIFGFIIYHETLGLRDVIGGLVILCAVFLTNLLDNREDVDDETEPIPD
jgi:drug/metabolite transporter (DMT)-like permease